jgi:thymidine kinase
MFSGKSEELIRRLKRAQIARRRVLCFKPDLDVRYHKTAIASHSLQTLDAATVANVEALKAVLFPVIDQIEVIGVDESQFFDESPSSRSRWSWCIWANESSSPVWTPPSPESLSRLFQT